MNKIIEYLLEVLPKARLVSNNTELNCRCMFCPDSKNPNNKHFYISVPQKENDIIFFHCKKCQSSGILTHKILMEWNLFDKDISIELINHNKKAFNNNLYYNLSQDIYRINNTIISNNDLSKYKLDYINTRLGTNLNYSDILDSKIVLNLQDILYENNITKYTRDPRIIKQLNDNFIGFLSYDNSYINLRRIVDEGIVYSNIDKRYVNYNIFNKVDNTSNYYTLPNAIDINKPISMCIAEGPFDTLSIRYNLHKSNDNTIFSTVQGNNYLGCIRHFLNILAVPNIDIHVYLDQDVNDYVVPHIKDNLYLLGNNVFTHWNLLSKDMGVPLSNIQESIERIL